MPVTNPIARSLFNYEELKDLSPSQVRALIPAAGYAGGVFDWNEYHRVTNNFWKTHNDDAARSEIRGPGFSGGGYGPAVPVTPPATTAVTNPIARDPATIPPGEPVVTKPPETPGVTLPPVPTTGTPTPAVIPPGGSIVTNPAAVYAQKNLQRFANDPVLGQVFTPPAQSAQAIVAPAAAANAPLVFQNEDELLAAAMEIITRMRGLNAGGQPGALRPVTGTDSLSTAPYISPAALKTDPFGIAANAQSQPKAAAPMTFPSPAVSIGLGATTSGTASPGVGLGARVSGIFNDERTMANG